MKIFVISYFGAEIHHRSMPTPMGGMIRGGASKEPNGETPVLAETMEDALALFREAHPNRQINVADDRGPVLARAGVLNRYQNKKSPSEEPSEEIREMTDADIDRANQLEADLHTGITYPYRNRRAVQGHND